jgi:hypothetical protein
MCDVPCILVYDCSNYTNICTNYFFTTYTRLHVSTLLGHHQGAIDYQIKIKYFIHFYTFYSVIFGSL